MGTLIGIHPTSIFVKKSADTGRFLVATGNTASTSGFVPGMNAAPVGFIGIFDMIYFVGISAAIKWPARWGKQPAAVIQIARIYLEKMRTY